MVASTDRPLSRHRLPSQRAESAAYTYVRSAFTHVGDSTWRGCACGGVSRWWWRSAQVRLLLRCGPRDVPATGGAS